MKKGEYKKGKEKGRKKKEKRLTVAGGGYLF
jgi:hypothetical protein